MRPSGVRLQVVETWTIAFDAKMRTIWEHSMRCRSVRRDAQVSLKDG